MSKSNRYIIGVIASQLSDIEQSELLSGMLRQAQERNIDLLFLSNIYNPNDPANTIERENDIYDLILSDAFDGLILFSETILNTTQQKLIVEHLSHMAHVPLIALGTPQPGFVLEHFQFLNTSDALDFERITDHLIEKHGFTNMEMLTGFDFIEASHQRVAGYRASLERHGLPYDPDKVHFGDFWMNSGAVLAESYIKKDRPFPQAVLCGNDYMAYGMLDTLAKNGISVPDRITITGYEYIQERIYHYPILTTYQRNRAQLGAEAIRLMQQQLNGHPGTDFTPPPGRLIPGDSCQCGLDPAQLLAEQERISLKRTDDFLNLFGQLELELTECRTIPDLLQVCRKYRYMLRHAEEVYLCLYEDWYNDRAVSETVTCYSLLAHEEPFTIQKHDLERFCSGSAAAYSFSPLFFLQRSLGYAVMKFHTPEANTPLYRHWLKAVSNGLEFLRLKNDIQYLTQCCNLSESVDNMTDMYSKRGFHSAFDAAIETFDARKVHLVVLRVCLFDESYATEGSGQKIQALLAASDAVKCFCAGSRLYGRVEENTFACVVRADTADSRLLADLLGAILLRAVGYTRCYGTDSFVCTAQLCTPNSTYQTEMPKALQELDQLTRISAARRTCSHYREMLALRNQFYLSPEVFFETDSTGLPCSYSSGHLRTIYKACFGVNPHQDCITGRILLAWYLLFTTQDSIQQIAQQCGYRDSKYFLRQFRLHTGMTPVEYRRACSLTDT